MAKPKQTTARWLNLRTVVMLMAVYALLVPVKPSVLDWVDRGLFSLGNSLVNRQAPQVDVAIVTLPEAELKALREDWGKAGGLNSLLRQLSTDRQRAIGIIHDQQPNQIQGLAQQLLTQVSAGNSLVGDLKAQVDSYTQTRNSVASLFKQAQIIHGVPLNDMVTWTANGGTLPYVPREETTSSDIVNWLPSWLQPPTVAIDLLAQGGDETAENIFSLTPFLPHEALAKTLILHSTDGVHAEFLLSLYARRGGAQSITWLRNQAAKVNNATLPLSPDGSFNAYYSAADAPSNLVPRLSLVEAIDKPPTQLMVLIGAENSPVLDQAAYDLLSLDNQHYFYASAWLPWVKIGTLLLVLLYLVVILPRMSYAAAVFASCLLLFIFIVAQLGWQITQSQYLPLGLSIQLLIAGHILMLLWTLQRENWNQLQAAAHGARYQLGMQLFRDGRADDALLAIKECFSSDAVLNLMYDIASQQERKRQYGEAVKTYQNIIQRQGNFRDAKEKVEKLIAFSSGTNTGSFGVDSTISKTLIVSESAINKPVLGRYEIERELGRGAMGIVYLGRDPKIARQVAIKTLSYNNISGRELDEFKERFFREAEAAGRLSHPNIVTIYDVGEEHDLAFIAMDYVEGLSLGAYSDEENLLPVETVYRIVIAVAEALNYAHEKKVVHRDIKPSNIMYETATEKVKVTDFGVARIVDNTRTQTGDILGSPLYMSPEQLKGAKVTSSSDIYSLGVTFYQLLTGKLPHSGDSLANLTYNIIHEKHVGVRDIRPELPKNLTRIINKAMHKDPSKRYGSAKDLANALSRALAEDFALPE